MPWKVEVTGGVTISSCLSRPDVISGVSKTVGGLLRLEIYNTSNRVINMTPKSPLIALNGYDDVEVVRLGKTNALETVEEIASDSLTKEIATDFADVGDLSEHPVVEEMRPLAVRGDEVCWVPPRELGRRTPYRTEQSACRKTVAEQLATYVTKGYLKEVSCRERVALSPLLPIRKKDGSYRFTNDFRWLNVHFKRTGMAQVDVWRKMWSIDPEWKYYAKLDLKDGFFAIPIDESLQGAFAFTWGDKRYKWTRLPQGWTWSPILFSERVSEIIRGLNAVQFVDDLLIGGRSMEELRFRLRAVMGRLQRYGLKVNFTKTAFLTRSVKFLGVEISHGSWSLVEYYREKLKQIGRVRSWKDLERIIGVLSYIRRTVVGLEGLISPLRQLLKEARRHRQSTEWWARANLVLGSTLRRILDRQVFLQLPGLHVKRYILETDWAGDFAGYLLFADAGSRCYLCDLGSKKVTESTSSFLGELKALTWAAKTTKPLRGDAPLLIRTDNEALAAKLECGDCGLNDKRALRCFGWLIGNETFSVEFLPGELNQGADLLSRPKAGHEQLVASTDIDTDEDDVSESEHHRRLAAMSEAHAGHFGHVTTSKTLRAMGYSWKGLESDVRRFVLECRRCAQYGRPIKRPLWSPIEVSRTNEVICADHQGPLRWPNGTTSVHVLVLVDVFSRYVQLRVSRSATAESVIGGLKRWTRELGRPTTLFSDPGAAFTAHSLANYCARLEISHKFTAVAASYSNGIAERAVQTVLERIKREGPTCEWRPMMRRLEVAINRAWHSGIGCPPIYIMHGITLTGDSISALQLSHLHDRAKRYTDRRRAYRNKKLAQSKPNRRELRIGDKVAVKKEIRQGKLDAEWLLGYTIRGRHSSQLYDLSDQSGHYGGRKHAHQLRLLSA